MSDADLILHGAAELGDDDRIERALDLIQARAVRHHVNLNIWLVQSQTDPSFNYATTSFWETSNPSCTCADFRRRRETCKHIIAATLRALQLRIDLELERGGRAEDVLHYAYLYQKHHPSRRARALYTAALWALAVWEDAAAGEGRRRQWYEPGD